MGKLCKLNGVVISIQEVPPSQNISGQLSEIIMMTEDTNSQLGSTCLDLLYSGNPDNISPESRISFAGYFVGTVTGAQYVGETLVFVGNAIDQQHQARTVK